MREGRQVVISYLTGQWAGVWDKVIFLIIFFSNLSNYSNLLLLLFNRPTRHNIDFCAMPKSRFSP